MAYPDDSDAESFSSLNLLLGLVDCSLELVELPDDLILRLVDVHFDLLELEDFLEELCDDLALPYRLVPFERSRMRVDEHHYN